jgi:hypothetical protein
MLGRLWKSGSIGPHKSLENIAGFSPRGLIFLLRGVFPLLVAPQSLNAINSGFSRRGETARLDPAKGSFPLNFQSLVYGHF